MTQANPIFIKYKTTHNSPEEIMTNFFLALDELKITPYKAQEDAIFEIMSGNHLILSTPTGSGKSLVAFSLFFKGFNENKRSYYTCPIKALVSEKFFALCEMFGAENVGMLTGDASINKDASIICCTAEVLANLALAEGENAQIDYVVMDEFHYFSDKERGVAWQIPLLSLPQTTFLLMSATIGDASKIKEKIETLTKKKVSEISSLTRPVPLTYTYSENPLHETIAELIASKKYPIYVVNFTQRECAERAQDCMSVNICSKEEKQKIIENIKNFKFDTPFGKEIRRFITHGVGIHNAGMLPKYRLLIEKFAQMGLLKIIMGTDTLGVGVNVPIRSVLFTKLYKFDGQKRGILSVRDFKQIAGRAGRKGFDDEGFVIAQAPEHVIENKRQENKFSKSEISGKKKSSIKKVAPPKDFVHYDENTFNKLINDPPESLQSQFKITHGMILNSMMETPGNANNAYKKIITLIHHSFETEKSKSSLRKMAALLLKSLIHAQVVMIVKNIKTGSRLVLNDTLQKDFSLHHTLALYLLEVLTVLEEKDENYALDILSLVESIEENPQVILLKQLEQKKSQALAQMKMDGLSFDERIEKLDEVEYDKPLAELIYQTFNLFTQKHPWLKAENIHPKSIARSIFEKGATFNEYVLDLGLARSEGILLRYISQVYKTLMQTVPIKYKNDNLIDLIAFYKTMLIKVDTSLIDEWESLFNEKESESKKENKEVLEKLTKKEILARLRSELYYLVQLLSLKKYEEFILCLANKDEWNVEKIEDIMSTYYQEHREIIKDPRAKNAFLTRLTAQGEYEYIFNHTLLDDNEENNWFLSGKLIISEDKKDDIKIYLTEIAS